ncbi:protein kinase domain protein [Ichthyophthirius multifiliis]|uniref:Protein kinase domain protein n=1 Tax=Ichthyophthirius multifiliis TaxID=5932 RepID=G0QPT8_ICHMU|nr:protein kinase domain protein [Ichthyophthirius multifiliis]EGR32768.1 protein kinase domain protein [Ichthyophthirius multifiliis]|eukprot:XP_004036754.1 protein kinase domain protein [Ichthyophthirius multifiliis]
MKKIDNYQFKLLHIVGKGASSTVYLGENTLTGENVAIKVIDLQQIKDEYTWSLISQEIYIMQKLNNKNIVRLIDVYQTQNNAYIVTELCQGGDLIEYMKKNKNKISQKESLKIIENIIFGLEHLFMHGVIHRDLKPANILISENGNIFKISDFGFARKIENEDFLMKSLVGTPLYMSPQILKRQNYTYKCDIWSLGIIFYQLIYGKTPWPSNSVIDLVNNMFQMPLLFPQYGQNGDLIDESVKEFIKGCLQFEENERFSWEDIMKIISFD